VSYRGRFAPSPTGGLHWGNLLVAFCVWARAYRAGGVSILRMEDIDQPRVLEGAHDEILADLNYLNLIFDEGPQVGGPYPPYVQQQGLHLYDEAAEHLRAQGRVFACTCSRKDLQNVASAPHQGEETVIYPGTCRDKEYALVNSSADVAWRFRVNPGQTTFKDVLAGTQIENVSKEVGDFVIKRKDGLWAYHLAVVVDDIRQGVTEVVRGRDLLSSTARQLQLYEALGAQAPLYVHIPLWLDDTGHRLSKRRGDDIQTIGRLRRAGVSPEKILGVVGQALDLCAPGESLAAINLADRLENHVLQRHSVTQNSVFT
jgi:glutamyl-tRNA synthetase